MRVLPKFAIPWQVTGNHWLTLPCIHPVDGSLYALGVLHRGARAAVEFAGSAEFLEGKGPPLLRPRIRINGTERELGGNGLVWERALGWIPTFTCTLDQLVLRGTIFAPYGRDADAAGAVYAVAVENRGSEVVQVMVALEGMLGHRQLRVRTPRALDDEHRVIAGDDGVLVLDGGFQPSLAALAIAADGEWRSSIDNANGARFTIERSLVVAPSETQSMAFF
ncbi:MAG TPA: hypothetical protein VF722_09800, partial [Gemmatimonadaceae bacterium]